MSPDDKYDKIPRKIGEKPLIDDDSGEAGATGAIQFVDFLSTTQSVREDHLPPEEVHRLLSTHQDEHERRTKHQKDVLKQREEVKNGKTPLRDYRQGRGGAGAFSQYKQNPVLNCAQFSGYDPTVSPLPDQNVAETNEIDRKQEELQYQLQLQQRPQNTPHFTPPRPQPR